MMQFCTTCGEPTELRDDSPCCPDCNHDAAVAGMNAATDEAGRELAVMLDQLAKVEPWQCPDDDFPF